MVSPKILNHSSGFTLMELLITLGILVLIFSLGLLLSLDFYRTFAFRAEQNTIVSVLSKARGQSMSNLHGTAHGVRFDPSGYIIFQGSSYASRVPGYDETIELNPSLSPSGMTEVVFNQLSGDAIVTGGNLTISGPGKTATISINNEGQISW